MQMTYQDHLSGQVIQINLQWSKCVCLDASRREEHDGVKHFGVSFVVQKLVAKMFIY